MKAIALVGVLSAVVLAAAIGWVLNIMAILAVASDPVTGMLVLRCIGIFIAPLGAVLGYL